MARSLRRCDWRTVLVAGAAAGLAAAPIAGPAPVPAGLLPAAGIAALAMLARAAPRTARLAAIALAATLAGLWIGAARLAAIDAGALHAADGVALRARGFVAAVPRRLAGRVRIELETAAGRLAVEAPEPVADLAVGTAVRVRGSVREPAGWEAAYLARHGIARVLVADGIEPTGARRGGVAGLTDAVRGRAERALSRGVGAPEAALLRGFVLGQDDRIAPQTVTDFKRSGLAHLLAVSGENVMLLGLLAGAVLALLGVPLRSRLLCVLALIAVYVPVTGAGPSIQRAGVMGAAGVIALLAGRPRARWHAVLLAAALTLAVNPRAAADPGWQLSFAAVAGIMLWAAPIRDALPASRRGSPLGRVVAEGAAVTIAATLATAPLFAHHFESVSLAALPANLLALPAVAPMMWLGMVAAAAGQAPWLPVEPVSALAGALAAYVAQVAHWLAQPGPALVAVRLETPIAIGVAYAALAALLAVVLGWLRRRRGTAAGRTPPPALAIAAAAALVLAALLLHPEGEGPAGARPGLRLIALDVGQGDAIVLDPAPGPAILIDGGPAGSDLAARLRALGITRLAATVVTHGQADHAGGIAELLGALPVRRLIYADSAGAALPAARAAGVPAVRIAEGSGIRSGGLAISVLWPPRAGAAPDADPNSRSLVLLARWRSFDALLTGDAEAELVPLDPGPLDVLKVAHHGSEDAGLDALLGRSAPRLAVVSAGVGNPYGHPAPATLATLEGQGVAVARTDLAGDVVVEVERDGFTWEADG